MTRIPLSVVDEKAKELTERLEMSTAEIGLSVRTTNCLEERGIFTVHDLLQCTREDLLSISNFGEKTLDEVYKALASIGFCRRKIARRPRLGCSSDQRIVVSRTGDSCWRDVSNRLYFVCFPSTALLLCLEVQSQAVLAAAYRAGCRRPRAWSRSRWRRVGFRRAHGSSSDSLPAPATARAR